MARPNGKRKADAIDLTTSDDEITASQSRKAPRHDPPGGFTQSQRDNWTNERTEEERADDILILSQEDDDNTNQSYELYGTLSTKVVGIQYYTGHATVGEHVVVRREPSNPYDRNALRVENVQRAQVGHIPRTMASKLAKYMDAGKILVEGSLTGNKGAYDCPIDLKLFGTSDPTERSNLVDQMRVDKLPLDGIIQRAREEKKRKADELKKLKSAKRGGVLTGSSQEWSLGSSQTEYASSPSSSSAPVQDLQQIMADSQRFNPREMGEVVEKFGAGEDILAAMPMADFPEALATRLLPYQRQALAWLLDKENPELPAAGSADVVQLWKRAPGDPRLFTNIATNFSTRVAPALSSGGILADDMGLGKTLEMISLILSDVRSGPTLIISPLGVLSNWSDQIRHHVKPESALRVLTYHGNAKRSGEDFNDYDVVITTYGALSSEYVPRGAKDPPPIPRKDGLFSITWRRIILDEGHIIRNPSTKSSLAASGLLAQSRWILTGTPIINSLKDLYSLVRFLKFTGGLERLEIFNSVLIRPLNQGHEAASLLLQALMSTTCLRRKKEMKFVDLRLPEISEYVHNIEFLPHEQEKYDALQAEGQGLLRKYENRIPSSRPQDTYRHLLEILLRLRQVCNHWKLCGERVTSLLADLEEKKVVDLTPENRQALQEMLQLSIDSHEDCPICLESLHNPVITACAHVFGNECIERVIETQHRCPMCRAEPLELESLVRPKEELGGESALPAQQADIDPDSSSSKVEALFNILQSTQKSKPGTKTIIFSQWTSFLDIVQAKLKEQNLVFARIDGTMRAAARDNAMTALQDDPNCTIMLASLAVCSVGLNLVAANQVILADSWWAPAIEDQAIDRVHRLGQQKEVTVWRLVMEGSIEQKVLDIQADKRKLMMTAFREAEGKRGKKGTSRLGDIQRLLG